MKNFLGTFTLFVLLSTSSSPFFCAVPSLANETGNSSKSTKSEVDRAMGLMDQASALPDKRSEEQKALMLQALQLVEGVIKESPREAKAWWVRGNIFYCLSRRTEAEQSIRKSLEIDPKFARAYSSLGQMYAEDNKNEEAVDAWRKAVEADPSYVNAWANIGQAYQLQGKLKESLECWRKVVALDDLDWHAWSKIVQCSDSQEESEMARKKLFSLHDEGKIKTPRFCREQFQVGTQKVMAFEYFVPEGWEHVRYEFFVMGKTESERPKYRYVLGEIDGDTELARNQKTIGPDEHMFCVDGFHPAGRQTLVAMIKGKETPAYDAVRKIVCDHIAKQVDAE